jgi:hypothetical protein
MCSRAVINLVETIAGNCLVAALWTSLHVAANNVGFPFYYTAVMTRASIGTPIIQFVAVPNALEVPVAKVVMCDGLGFANFLRPALNHPGTAINYEELWNFVPLAHFVIRQKLLRFA